MLQLDFTKAVGQKSERAELEPRQFTSATDTTKALFLLFEHSQATMTNGEAFQDCS
jgi:hypothetical protein